MFNSTCYLSNQKTIRICQLRQSHKKQKDGLETRAVLMIFSLERETSGVLVHKIHQNSEKS